MELDNESIREYFPQQRVLDGMFGLASELFGVRVEPGDPSVETWHPDVKFYQMRAMEQPGQPVIAYFYIDPYIRPGEKTVGSWTDDFVKRSKVFGTTETPVRLPVFCIAYNEITPADEKSDVLMSFTAILQVFRTFGMGLRLALTEAEYSMASDIDGVELEAVQLTAILWQYFCYNRRKLPLHTTRPHAGH
ncbi:unnamed protein product [Aphanomyces euteiches]